MSVILTVKKYLRKYGVLAPLGFDQQVWGAKSVMDLVQHGSQFLLAEATPDGIMYTCWSGRRDNKPYAITIDPTGHAIGPFYDSSKIGDCMAWSYPPKFSCLQAQAALVKSGITQTWTWCRLRQAVAPQGTPFYDFTFDGRNPVHVDADTGQVTPT
jgi:hypothetical protein